MSKAQLLLAEYQALKDEQKARIGFRDNLLYVTLGAVVTALIAGMQFRIASALLVLPVICLILGWTYLANDEKISAIGRYVSGSLTSRLADSVSAEASETDLFAWEKFHQADERRKSRKIFQCGIDLTCFCLIPFAALVGYWLSPEPIGLLILASVLEAIAILLLGWQMLIYARTHFGD
ncbi:hypothetical protein [Nonomuraea maritima]|uniref:hypothetical protein n=1 Tax=Nonomuraea maritima TaxID=683260 RepID=UPI001C409F16|nr:hypothetical protein [Nonomuraea maritima]